MLLAVKFRKPVPIVLGIADVVAERALPDAWIVDFTNPVGIVSQETYLLHTSVRENLRYAAPEEMY